MRGITRVSGSRRHRSPSARSSSARERSSFSRPANNRGDAFARIPLRADSTNDVAIARVPRRRLRDPRETRHARVSAKNDPDARGRSRSRQYARARPSADRSRARAARGSGEKASRANPVLERSASRFISETRSEVDSQQLERRGSVSSMIDSWCAFFQRLVARRASLLRFRRGFRVAFDQDRSVATADRAPPRTLARDGTRTGPEDRASFAISRSRARARAPPSPPPPPPARRLSRAPP